MKNILRFMKGSRKIVIVILLLLVAQAWCDLSLPDLTSKVLNIGLQQGGIEDAVPDTIRAESLEDLELFVPDEDIETIEKAYGEADGNGVRHLLAEADREELNALLLQPESILYGMANAASFSMDSGAAGADADESAQGETKAGVTAQNACEGTDEAAGAAGAAAASLITPDNIRLALKLGMMTKDELLERAQEMLGESGALSDTYLKQVAVRFVSDEYAAQGVDLDALRSRYLYISGAKMLLMTVLMSAIAILIGLLAARVSARTAFKLRGQLYEKVMRFGSAEMESFSSASLITRATNDVQQVQMVIVIFLRMVLYAPVLAGFGIFRVTQYHAGMGWIIVLAVVILCACIGILMGFAMPKFRIMQQLVDRLNLVSRELLTGIMPIRAFHREEHEEERFGKANDDLYRTQLFTNRTMSLMMPVMMLVMNGISVLIVWVGAHRVDLGAIQVGDLTAFITYSMVIVMGFLMISAISIMLPRASVAAARIAEVLDKPVSLTDPAAPRDEEIVAGEGRVEFKDVGFAYPGAEAEAVKNISFTAEPGKTTAIIGSTGCGKSTLLYLLLRFYDVSEGSITIDGVDIREVSQKTLRGRIGYVPQKGRLFTGTIKSNIKYGGEEISDEDMKMAAHIAQAQEFIDTRKEGYDAPVAQEGSNVSGGQRQRLSIARAIAKKPKIFLFDDAFSALDFKTDLALRKELAEKTQGATVIIVAQRISTILHADKILCIEDGEIAGMGTHAELLESCQAYREIAKSQLSEEELAGTAAGAAGKADDAKGGED